MGPKSRADPIDTLYFEYDSITKENLETLSEKLPEAAELCQFLLSRFGHLRALIGKPSLTLTYNDFYWTNLTVRKDKQAAVMFDYNLLGKGYRYSDFRNVRSSLSEAAGQAFTGEYEKLYTEKHGRARSEEEQLERQIDEVIAPLFELITAFGKAVFPPWAEWARSEAVNGNLLMKARTLIS